jgi:ATP-dependent Clp protease ATP-binding subunit ClpC
MTLEADLQERCDETLVSLYGDAFDYAERMKSKSLTSFHFLLAYFSTPSEASVLFEEAGISYRNVAEVFNSMVKMSRISGNALKEPVDTIKEIEETSLRYLLNKGQKVTPLHFLVSICTKRNSIAHRILTQIGVLTDIRLAAMKLIDEPAKRIAQKAIEMKRESTRINFKGKASSSIQTKVQPEQSGKAEPEDEAAAFENPEDLEKVLKSFGRNLTDAASKGVIDPVFGRSREIELIIDVLGRKKNNNPLIIGPAGSGKTAIVEGLALKQCKGLLPGKEIWELSLSSLIGGTEYRGSLEKRISEILEVVEKNRDRVIIFIDEIHLIFSSGNDAVANMLKPALSRGSFPLIGATTTSEFSTYIAKDPAMERRFSVVKIDEPKGEELLRIVENAAKTLSTYHGVRIDDHETVKNAIILSDRYISGKSQPDKVLSLLDTLGSVLKRERKKEATNEDLMTLVCDRTGVPMENLLIDPGKIISSLPEVLDSNIVGQSSAKEKVMKLLARRFGNRVDGKPLASFIFAGPTGTGKTEMAKKMASFLFGSEERMVVLDMSEFQEQHSVSRLIGSPPGYTGFEEGGRLTEAFRREPYQLLLLDEIEKAHPKVLSILLQILGEGRVTDSRGFVSDMRESIIIMTSNLGADLFSTVKVGFGGTDPQTISDEEVVKKISGFLTPELINRVDDIAVFRPFTSDQLENIARISIKQAVDRFASISSLNFKADYKSLTSLIVSKLSQSDRTLGARAVKRVVETLVEGTLTEMCFDADNQKSEFCGNFEIFSDGTRVCIKKL